jgi:hypothetical protein
MLPCSTVTIANHNAVATGGWGFSFGRTPYLRIIRTNKSECRTYRAKAHPACTVQLYYRSTFTDFIAMSLVEDEYLLELWKEAQKPSSLESASVAFWNQLFSKYIFAEKEWVVAPETALAETDSLRRVDLVIKYFGRESLEVLCFHELKRISASPADLEEVEYQAFKACIAYLAQHPKINTVYAITSFGTKARGWTCTKDSDYLEPLFGSEDLAKAQDYIEAHSSDAQMLRKVFDHMKRFPPVARRGIVQGDIHQSVVPLPVPSNVAADTFAGKGKAVNASLASAKTQSQNVGEGREPPRLVRSMEYEKAGRKYRTFELDGKKHSVWSDQWQQAKFEGRLVWFCKDLYVVTEVT